MGNARTRGGNLELRWHFIGTFGEGHVERDDSRVCDRVADVIGLEDSWPWPNFET